MNSKEKIRKGQGARLRRIRIAAGYTSARAAALGAGWPESSYRAHESGTRTIDPDDAARYAVHFLKVGAQHPPDTTFSGKWIIYGDEDDLTEASLDELVQGESPAFRRKALDAILALKKR